MKKWQCVVCGFIYDEAVGMPWDGIPAACPGIAFPSSAGCWRQAPTGLLLRRPVFCPLPPTACCRQRHPGFGGLQASASGVAPFPAFSQLKP
ncbi:MAG: Rubredoxin [Moraxellaceae bacterium]|nr:Rubredoxin [Moraxellaceae bacterium]